MERSTWDSAARWITASGRASKKDLAHGLTVPDVGYLETVVRSVQRLSKRLDVARVGKHVKGDDILTGRHQPPHHTGADESRPARYQYVVHVSSVPDEHGSGGCPTRIRVSPVTSDLPTSSDSSLSPRNRSWSSRSSYPNAIA